MVETPITHHYQETLAYWQESAQQDWETAIQLKRLKRYHHALFFCHLTLEKLLKWKIIILHKVFPEPTHDLWVLYQRLHKQCSTEEKKELREISGYNLNARYDNYKREFYHKATTDYVSTWWPIVEKWKIWAEKN